MGDENPLADKDSATAQIISWVQATLLRPLTPSETVYMPVLCERALSQIVTALDRAGIDASQVAPDVIADVQTDMIVRVLRNPDGFETEGDGQYSYRLRAEASGKIELTEQDRQKLGIAGEGLFIWNPHYRTPTTADE